jgi:hypothetical protein
MSLRLDVMRLSGQLAWSQDHLFYRDPALHEFRQLGPYAWQTNLHEILVAHPGTALLKPFADPQNLVSPKLNYYQRANFSPILPEILDAAIWLQKWPKLLL